MKKIYTLLFALLCAATMVAQQPNVARNQSVKKAPTNAAAFSFNDIQNWTGEGSKIAAMALKWSYNLAQGDTPSDISFASTGCSGRTLSDKSWDLWLYSLMTGPGEWGALVSAPSNQTQTGVEDVQANKTVAGVKYVNLAGQMSDTAFSGVNIVVTTYTDGTTSTVKVIK